MSISALETARINGTGWQVVDAWRARGTAIIQSRQCRPAPVYTRGLVQHGIAATDLQRGGEIALVTGAGAGIGFANTTRFAREGAIVAVNAARRHALKHERARFGHERET